MLIGTNHGTKPIRQTFNISELSVLIPSLIGSFKSLIDDRFNEVNYALLGHMASFNPKDSFAAFNLDIFVKLAGFYLDDFD